MKLLSFAKDGGAHVGAVVPEGIVDLTAALQATNPEIHAAGSLLGIIQSGARYRHHRSSEHRSPA